MPIITCCCRWIWFHRCLLLYNTMHSGWKFKAVLSIVDSGWLNSYNIIRNNTINFTQSQFKSVAHLLSQLDVGFQTPSGWQTVGWYINLLLICMSHRNKMGLPTGHFPSTTCPPPCTISSRFAGSIGISHPKQWQINQFIVLWNLRFCRKMQTEWWIL